MVDKIIEARNISKSYQIDGRTISVLTDIDLDIDCGEFVVVAGASGSGKTTLLSLLSGLDCPSNGSVKISGREITGLSEDNLVAGAQ